MSCFRAWLRIYGISPGQCWESETSNWIVLVKVFHAKDVTQKVAPYAVVSNRNAQWHDCSENHDKESNWCWVVCPQKPSTIHYNVPNRQDGSNCSVREHFRLVYLQCLFLTSCGLWRYRSVLNMSQYLSHKEKKTFWNQKVCMHIFLLELSFFWGNKLCFPHFGCKIIQIVKHGLPCFTYVLLFGGLVSSVWCSFRGFCVCTNGFKPLI